MGEQAPAHRDMAMMASGAHAKLQQHPKAHFDFVWGWLREPPIRPDNGPRPAHPGQNSVYLQKKNRRSETELNTQN